jgi:hypothetical protein
LEETFKLKFKLILEELAATIFRVIPEDEGSRVLQILVVICLTTEDHNHGSVTLYYPAQAKLNCIYSSNH